MSLSGKLGNGIRLRRKHGNLKTKVKFLLEMTKIFHSDRK